MWGNSNNYTKPFLKCAFSLRIKIITIINFVGGVNSLELLYCYNYPLTSPRHALWFYHCVKYRSTYNIVHDIQLTTDVLLFASSFFQSSISRVYQVQRDRRINHNGLTSLFLYCYGLGHKNNIKCKMSMIAFVDWLRKKPTTCIIRIYKSYFLCSVHKLQCVTRIHFLARKL